MTNCQTNPYAKLDLRKQIYLECRSMAEYALAKGKPVPASAIKNIEAFEEHHPAGEGNASPMQIRRDLDITALTETHNFLARLIEPVTPQVVLLLDAEQETSAWLQLLGPISLVRQLMLAALISVTIFVGLMATPCINTSTLAEDVLSANGVEQLARLVFYMGAAGLGASFAALYTANHYLSKGTYNPCYQASYWIRFCLGIIAGLLLAVLVSEKSIQSEEMLSQGVVRPLLAILGGFSADLLYTFLNRMVETFKSLFSGSTQHLLETKTQEAKIKLAGLETEGRMRVAKDLMRVQQKIGTETDPEQMKQHINEILQSLMQPNRLQ